MIVVSNSSLLIALAKIGKMHVLKEVFGEVLIPEAVWYEVVVKGKRKPRAEEVQVAALSQTPQFTPVLKRGFS